ncbi:MAG TPA: ABC transporter permease [Turneriella sp.]|nr:ABC transporter permease [Turneriella sp.]
MGYILKRFLLMVPTFIGIVTITFFLTKLRPDALTTASMGPDGMKESTGLDEFQKKMRAYYGLDKPLHEQYLQLWKNILTLDFSESRIDHRPVLAKIGEAVPITLFFNLITVFIVYTISIPLGIYMAIHDNSRREKFLATFLYVLYALPSFWVALMLLKYFGSAEHLDLFPLSGLVSSYYDKLNWYQKIGDVLWHIALPIAVMVYGSFAFLSRYMKSSFLEALKADYVRTARAKGLKNKTVIYIHALRNSVIPLVTLLGGLLPSLIGGSVILERIFSIPGMGKLAYDSFYANDDTVIIAIVSISSILTMVGIFLSDIAYMLVDPRIRYGMTEDH